MALTTLEKSSETLAGREEMGTKLRRSWFTLVVLFKLPGWRWKVNEPRSGSSCLWSHPLSFRDTTVSVQVTLKPMLLQWYYIWRCRAEMVSGCAAARKRLRKAFNRAAIIFHFSLMSSDRGHRLICTSAEMCNIGSGTCKCHQNVATRLLSAAAERWRWKRNFLGVWATAEPTDHVRNRC